MVEERRIGSGTADVRHAARLHELAAGLAVGIALLRDPNDTTPPGLTPNRQTAIGVFEQVLADLRQLSEGASRGRATARRPVNVRELLERDAKWVAIDLDLRTTGEESWLASELAELVCLVGREAIRNVKRHSGAKRCHITLDLSVCPFVLTAHDWGSGFDTPAPAGRGINLLADLAQESGAALTVSSQPGLGTFLVLTGPSCHLASGPQIERGNGGLRSVVAEESLSSRRRVATRRPNRAPGQQIS
jgi:hypothetical protein